MKDKLPVLIRAADFIAGPVDVITRKRQYGIDIYRHLTIVGSPSAIANEVPLDHDPKYHCTSTEAAIATEKQYAAHNYHPLPVVFAKASGTAV